MDEKKVDRAIRATFLAALAGGYGGTALFAWNHPLAWLIAGIVGSVYALPLTIIVGWPVHRQLVAFGWIDRLAYALTGTLAGAVSLQVVAWCQLGPADETGAALLVGACGGLAAGVVFHKQYYRQA